MSSKMRAHPQWTSVAMVVATGLPVSGALAYSYSIATIRAIFCGAPIKSRANRDGEPNLPN